MVAGKFLSGVAVLLGFAVFQASSARAEEAVTYTYDARGRLIHVARSGGPADGVEAAYEYDRADNRVRVEVTNAPGGTGDPGGGASLPPPAPLYVVVPLNGFTVIRVR